MSVTSTAAQAEVLFSATEAFAAARAYAESIASGVIQRDRAGTVPYAELAALDASGLLGITVPAAYGGPDLSPVVLAEVIRTIAAVDPAIAQIRRPTSCSWTCWPSTAARRSRSGCSRTCWPAGGWATAWPSGAASTPRT